jgi:hypothetical protein
VTAIRELTKAVVDERPRKVFTTCGYCGGNCYGRTCQGHADLPQLEREIYSQSNEVAAPIETGSATTSQPEGV